MLRTLFAIQFAVPVPSINFMTVNIRIINGNTSVPNPIASSCDIEVISVKLNAISPNKLGQTIPTVLQPQMTPIKIPTICIPTDVSGSSAGKCPKPNTNKKTTKLFIYHFKSFRFSELFSDIVHSPLKLRFFPVFS